MLNFVCYIPKVILRPVQSAIVPKRKLPTNIPAIYKLWAKDFFHWSWQTIPRSMVAVDENNSVSPTHPFGHAKTSESENWSAWQVLVVEDPSVIYPGCCGGAYSELFKGLNKKLDDIWCSCRRASSWGYCNACISKYIYLCKSFL